MYIIVCVKQVKNYNFGKRMTSAFSGINDMFNNPSDLVALSWAIKLKQLYGFKVITISMGPSRVTSLVRQLYSYGVDRAFLLTSPHLSGSDTYATSYALGNMIKTLFPEYSLIICGDKSLDSETGQVPHSLAMALGINSYANIVNILHDDKYFEITCEMDSTWIRKVTEERLLITVTQAPENYVNLPGIKNIIDSESKDVEIITCEDLTISDENVGQKGSFTKVVSLYNKNSVTKRNLHSIVFEEKKMEVLMKTLFSDRL